MADPSLAVVIPVYNEGEAVVARLREVTAVLAGGPGRAAPLIAVDDGGSDTSPAALDRWAGESPAVTVVHHPSNQGYGAALRTGAVRAGELGCDWVLFMDSDLTNPPADIGRFRAVLDGPFELVKASRYMPGGGVDGVPWSRRIVSVVGNRSAAMLSGLPITDLTNGFRAIRTEAFLAMPLQERGFPVILEELYWAARMGLRMTQIPSVLANRSGDQRPSAFGYRPAVVAAYARYAGLMAADRLRPSRKEQPAWR